MSGAASSARSPSVRTPGPAFQYAGVDAGTPPPVVKPMRKAEIQAQIRLRSQLKEVGKTHAPDGKAAGASDASHAVGPSGADELGEVSDHAVERDLEEGEVENKPKKKRAASNGPMMVAKHQFVCQQRENGVPYHEAVQKWKVSEERASIVAALPEAERKRRRY